MKTGYLDNYYARLGISQLATPEEIRSAYHQAAQKFHPDANDEPGSTEVFLRIQEAYETLSNPEKREAYDKTLPDDLSTPEDLLINTIYSRDILSITDSPQLVYVLVNMTAIPQPKESQAAGTPPLNLCIVLDTSTSMSGRRLDAVKETAIKIIHSLKSEDVLSIVTFNDRAEVIAPATRGQNKSKMESRVSMIQTRGGTEIGQGLQTGLREISHHLDEAYHNHLILITDGRTYGDEDKCLAMADEAALGGITINPLGIGSKWSDAFLDELACKTGGSSEYAVNPQVIKSFMDSKFGQISRNYANNVTLEPHMSTNVNLRYAFRISPDTSALKLGDKIPLGDISLDRSLSVLFEFMVASTSEEQKELILTSGNLQMLIPSLPIPKTDMRFTLSRQVAKDPKIEPPPRILVQAMSRLSLYQMQEKAKRELDDGQIDKATQRLKHLSQNLLESGEAELAHTVLLELESMEKTQMLSDSAQKQIKYGTRALVGKIDKEIPS
ncbi:MAG: VWA domain-containing protein [Anaerolineales bacterium]|jgi:Ca-activated chloride channel family protein